jgi:membrane fusion protein (multidrug efflux system)
MVRADSDSEARAPEQTGTFKATLAAAAAASTGASAAGATSEGGSPTRRRQVFLRLAIVAAVLAALGLVIWFFMQGKEETDDAYVDGHISNVGSRIAGTVSSVLVTDNQLVKAGQTLAQLDPNDYNARLEQAQASLEEARHQSDAAQSKVEQSSLTSQGNTAQASADVSSTEAQTEWAHAQLRQAEADIKQAEMKVQEQEAQVGFAIADFERYKAVYADRAVTKQQFDKARVACDVAQAQLEEARQALRSARDKHHQMAAQLSEMRGHQRKSQGGVTNALATAHQEKIDRAQFEGTLSTIKRAEAQVKQAQLDRSYCTIVSPVDGRIGRKNCEVGQRVEEGQLLLAVVQENPWITANYKETQIGKMHPGQDVEIKIDTFGGRTFKGKVDSIAPASGARFSMLPPDNATGNFTKVVQRVPIKIMFDEQSIKPIKDLISPGMSCIVTILTKK